MAESKDAFFKEMYTRVGQLTYVWGQLDHALAAMAYSIYHDYDNPPGNDEVPISLKRRLEYIKKSVRAFNIEASVRDDFINVLSRIKTESHTRNNIVHGAIIDFWIEKDQLHAASLNNQKSGSNYIERIYSFDDIQAAADRALELTATITTATQRMLTAARQQ
jgi:hypothetical protein|tara:strand:+ start:242 stop:730 length:489 start_codon:yes stop_codon:yes gene_type:complete